MRMLRRLKAFAHVVVAALWEGDVGSEPFAVAGDEDEFAEVVAALVAASDDVPEGVTHLAVHGAYDLRWRVGEDFRAEAWIGWTAAGTWNPERPLAKADAALAAEVLRRFSPRGYVTLWMHGELMVAHAARTFPHEAAPASAILRQAWARGATTRRDRAHATLCAWLARGSPASLGTSELERARRWRRARLDAAIATARIREIEAREGDFRAASGNLTEELRRGSPKDG